MRSVDSPDMENLRRAYAAAVVAHSQTSKALTIAVLRGELPTVWMIGAEQETRGRLNEASVKLHAAIARAKP